MTSGTGQLQRTVQEGEREARRRPLRARYSMDCLGDRMVSWLARTYRLYVGQSEKDTSAKLYFALLTTANQ